MRVDGDTSERPDHHQSVVPDASRGPGRCFRPAGSSLVRSRRSRPMHQASIGYDRPIGEWGNFRTDYMMLARHARAAIDQHQRARRWRAARSDSSGNINEIGADGERAFDRITVGMMLRVPNRRIMGNVMYQYGNARNFADSALQPAVQQPQSRRRLGPVGQRHPSSRVLHGQHAAAVWHPREHAGAVFVGAALQHHDGRRRQRRHGVQRSPGRRRPQQRARRVAVERQLPREPLVQSRRYARRRPGDARRRRRRRRPATRSARPLAAPATAVVAACR